MRIALALGLAGLLLALAPAATSAQEASPLPRFRVAPLEPTPAPPGPSRVVRFLTASEFPPFQFVGGDGNPAGLNVDLARAICARLNFPCTIQALPWDELPAAVESGRADALIAGMKPTAALRERLDLTRPYFRLPARFVALRDSQPSEISPDALAGKKVAVVQGTAHEAFLKAFFPQARLMAEADANAARAALREKRADLLFGDGVSLSLWIGGTESAECCSFVGGPYPESRFFGEGMVIAVKKGEVRLRQQLDRALDEIETSGAMADLYLRWFPIGIF
jgi:polar amino acid transport system substrate-binding protein